jgi:hypothetical protein
MPQRIALFWTTYSGFAPVRRVERELMLREKVGGTLVVGVYCDGALERCHGMKRRRRDYLECITCQCHHQDSVAPLADRMIHLPGYLGRRTGAAPPASQQALRSVRIGGSDIGAAVLSTIKTNHGDDDPPLEGLADEVAAQLAAARHVHARLAATLDEVRPDVVYMFNGRHFDSRPLLRLCQARGIDFKTYEMAVAPDCFAMAENATIHDNRATKARFADYLAQTLVASEHSSLRSQITAGQDIYGEGYRARQEQARMPAGWSPDRRNVVILHSSEDEHADVDHAPRLWTGQHFLEYLQALAASLEGEEHLRVYVRLHPRLARYNARSVATLLSFRHPLVEVLPPASPVDTFALACAADLCVCYGSTAGPEAVLLGARVVSVGDCAYAGSGMMPEARDIASLVNYVRHPEQVACRPDVASAYLQFLQSDGVQFRFAPIAEPSERSSSDPLRIEASRQAFLRYRVPYARLRLDYLLYRLVRGWLLARRAVTSIGLPTIPGRIPATRVLARPVALPRKR